jgi:Fic family protein
MKSKMKIAGRRGNPYITVGRARKLLNVSQPTARSAIIALVDAGVLFERTGRSWGRVYVAQRILDAIDVKPKPTSST